MQPNEYQALATRTARKTFDELSPTNAQLMNWLLGLAGEAGELCNSAKKCMFHRAGLVTWNAQDYTKLLDELGDVMWYASQLCNWLNVPLEDVMQTNIEKLKDRYPDSFPTDIGQDAHL